MNELIAHDRPTVGRLTRWVAAVGALCLISYLPVFAQELTPAREQHGPFFDTDRGLWLVDTDEDTYPDLSEEIAGTDPLDAASSPSAKPGKEAERSTLEPPASKVGFPASLCRNGFSQKGDRMCISGLKSAEKYFDAAATCRLLQARVCSYEDLYYLYIKTTSDGSFNSNGRFLGDYTGERNVLCGNRNITFNNDPDIFDFDGVCVTTTVRSFWCCHDKE